MPLVISRSQYFQINGLSLGIKKSHLKMAFGVFILEIFGGKWLN